MVLCTPEIVHVTMYLCLAFIAFAGLFHVLTHFNRLPGTVDWRDFVPFVSYARIFLNPAAMLTQKGYLYWKLYQVLYVLVTVILLLTIYAYLPACIAAIKAG